MFTSGIAFCRLRLRARGLEVKSKPSCREREAASGRVKEQSLSRLAANGYARRKGEDRANHVSDGGPGYEVCFPLLGHLHRRPYITPSCRGGNLTMKRSIPAHANNANTVGLDPVQSFDTEISATTAGQRAPERPAGRPRVLASLEVSDDPVQFFDNEAEPIPPGNKAKPRPKGRERKPEKPEP